MTAFHYLGLWFWRLNLVFCLSLIFACFDSHTTSSWERYFLPFRSVMGTVMRKLPGKGGTKSVMRPPASSQAGPADLVSRTAPGTARGEGWIDLFLTRFWLRFPLNGSCYWLKVFKMWSIFALGKPLANAKWPLFDEKMEKIEADSILICLGWAWLTCPLLCSSMKLKFLAKASERFKICSGVGI